MMNTPAPSVSRYFGAKPSQSLSPVPASTSATSNSEVLRRRARNSASRFKLAGTGIPDTKLPENFKHYFMPSLGLGISPGCVILAAHERIQTSRRNFDGQRLGLAGDESRGGRIEGIR